MAGVKGRSGGKRPGAGRPPKCNDCPTKVMRVPISVAKYIGALASLHEDCTNSMYLRTLQPEEEERRKKLFELLSELVKYEKERQEKLQESLENHKLDKYMFPLFEDI